MVCNESDWSPGGRLPVIRMLALSLLALACGQAAWSATYRWVDEKGQVHYSDKRPPESAAQLDKQGRVLESSPAGKKPPKDTALSPEEAAAAQAQKRRDQALLTTYLNEAEIDLARDRALAIEQTTLKGLQTRLENAKRRLTRLDGQIADKRKAGLAVPSGMQQMRDEAQDEYDRLSEMTKHSTQVVESIRARYEADKLRFRELRNEQR